MRKLYYRYDQVLFRDDDIPIEENFRKPQQHKCFLNNNNQEKI